MNKYTILYYIANDADKDKILIEIWRRYVRQSYVSVTENVCRAEKHDKS